MSGHPDEVEKKGRKRKGKTGRKHEKGRKDELENAVDK
jgi:hypothetical protein